MAKSKRVVQATNKKSKKNGIARTKILLENNRILDLIKKEREESSL